jgi:hypothetical protein
MGYLRRTISTFVEQATGISQIAGRLKLAGLFPSRSGRGMSAAIPAIGSSAVTGVNLVMALSDCHVDGRD